MSHHFPCTRRSAGPTEVAMEPHKKGLVALSKQNFPKASKTTSLATIFFHFFLLLPLSCPFTRPTPSFHALRGTARRISATSQDVIYARPHLLQRWQKR